MGKFYYWNKQYQAGVSPSGSGQEVCSSNFTCTRPRPLKEKRKRQRKKKATAKIGPLTIRYTYFDDHCSSVFLTIKVEVLPSPNKILRDT